MVVYYTSELEPPDKVIFDLYICTSYIKIDFFNLIIFHRILDLDLTVISDTVDREGEVIK